MTRQATNGTAATTQRVSSLTSQIASLTMQSHSAHATDPPPGEPNNTQHRIEELERQVGEIQEEVKEMQTTFNLLRVSLRKLEDDLNRRNAEAHNADAKAYNATIVDMGNLLPLHDLATNKPIDGFPKNVAAIRNMEDAELTRLVEILFAGYHPAPTNVSSKQERLADFVRGRTYDEARFY